MPSESKLPKLPTTKELLGHPRVKNVIERLSQSTVASRAADFYDDLRNTVSEKTNNFELPSLPHLAEQFAQRLLGDPKHSRSVINATGIVCGGEFANPLPEQAVHAMLSTAGEFRPTGPAIQDRVARQLKRLTGAESSLILSGYESALHLAVAALASGGELYVIESETSRSTDWQRIAASGAAALRNELPSESTARGGLLIRHSPLNEATAGLPAIAELADRYADLPLLEVSPVAGITDPESVGLSTIPHAATRIKTGADLVLIRGDGLIGGPTCGIFLGKQSLIDKLRAHSLATAVAANELVGLALSATLQLYESPDQIVFTVPAWSLLSTPLANLQQRAERLAQLIHDSPRIMEATACEIESAWVVEGKSQQLAAASWGVSVNLEQGVASSEVERLQRQTPQVAVKVTEADLFLDLRSVFPRWDQALVSAFA
ncbi:PLP-dependent aminotransferase family protein [Adhaeretor mobilis]|uniref:L-seryl-tRNA(Sec) selenium transferase n=1 Tax=Adhaeretor mobilis TaxID=1930276 RepID=A0A517MZ64_9BACT|nr:hypothetical protein [Adhaeretor mobilis]QDT00144.1 L-seryl-tRNA(Sec) selenium transferase [Adhaeretor mobilis]